MDKFVKDKLDTARIQPLPSTWEGIESQLDKDQKSVFLRRSLILLVGFLIIGISFYAMSDLWKSTSEVESSFVELESKSVAPHIENLEIEKSVTQEELEQTDDLVNIDLNPIRTELKSKANGFKPNIKRIETSTNIEPSLNNEEGTFDQNKSVRKKVQIIPNTAIPKSLLSLYDHYNLPYTIEEMEQGQENFMVPADTMFLPLKKHKFSIQQTIGVTSTFYTNSLSGLNYLNDSRGSGVDLQLLVGYDLSRKWSIQTGIRYAKYGWDASVGEPAINANTGESQEGNEVVNYLKYVSIPFYANYKLARKGPLSFSLGGGLSGDLLFSATVTEYIPASGNYSFINLSENSKADGRFGTTQSLSTNSGNGSNSYYENVLEKYNWSYHLNIPVAYSINRVEFSAIPFGVWQGKNFISTTASERKANGYGVKLGVKLKL